MKASERRAIARRDADFRRAVAPWLRETPELAALRDAERARRRRHGGDR